MSLKELVEVKDEGRVIARYVPAELAWKDGLNFFSPDEDFIQVGTWGYDKDKQLLAHIHNKVPRHVDWTQEVLFIHSGSLKAHIYNRAEELVEEWVATTGDLLVMLGGGHGYTILEDGTKVLEIKNGPYVGAEQDRRRI